MHGPPQDSAREAEREAIAESGGGRLIGLYVLMLLLVVVLLGGGRLAEGLQRWPAVAAWSTVFVSLVLQALPFLVLGVALSAAITAWVPAERIARLLPRRPALAVPAAGVAGAVLPGCECASVPVAGSLVARGVAQAVALTFLLAAPAINPVVLVSTAVAFPGRPEMVLARFGASLGAAVVIGWWWLRFGKDHWLTVPRRPVVEGPPGEVFRAAMQHDVLHAGGFLAIGAALAASVNTFAPPGLREALGEQPWLAVLACALLAVAVAICSEADAFVAAGFTHVSPTAQLAFMVVGPMVDVKLIAMHAGTFGRGFAARFDPAVFVVAVAFSVVAGAVLL